MEAQTRIKKIGLSILILLILIPSALAAVEDSAYISLSIVGVGLIFFLLLLSTRMDFGIIKVGGGAVPMLRFFVMLIAGWVAVGVADIAVGIVELQAIVRLEGATNGIYTGMTYTMIGFTFAFGILFLYWVFMKFKEFGGQYL